MEKKKMSARDKMVLFIVAAVGLLLISYFLFFTKFNEKKAALAAENVTLKEEVDRLEAMEAQKDAVAQNTQEYQEHIQSQHMDQFPSEVRTQNAIYELNEMCEKISNVTIESENYSMNNLFYQPGASLGEDGNFEVSAEDVPVDEEAAEGEEEEEEEGTASEEKSAADIVAESANYYGYRSDISVAFTAPYESMKRVINYINGAEDKMTITDISATKSEETEDLSCTMNISMYAISGTGEDYVQPDVDSFGRINKIFGN